MNRAAPSPSELGWSRRQRRDRGANLLVAVAVFAAGVLLMVGSRVYDLSGLDNDEVAGTIERQCMADDGTENDDGGGSRGEDRGGNISSARSQVEIPPLPGGKLTVVELNHKDGAFVYSQGVGWFKFDGKKWKQVKKSKVPPDLLCRYQAPEQYLEEFYYSGRM